MRIIPGERSQSYIILLHRQRIDRLIERVTTGDLVSTTASENYGAWIEGMKRYNKDIGEDIL